MWWRVSHHSMCPDWVSYATRLCRVVCVVWCCGPALLDICTPPLAARRYVHWALCPLGAVSIGRCVGQHDLAGLNHGEDAGVRLVPGVTTMYCMVCPVGVVMVLMWSLAKDCQIGNQSGGLW